MNPEASLVRDNVCATYTRLAKLVPGTSFDDSLGCMVVRSEQNLPLSNCAFGFNIETEEATKRCIRAMQAECRLRSHFRLFCMTGDTPADISQQLTVSRFTLVNTMHHLVIDAAPDTKSQLTVSEVTSQTERHSVSNFIVDNFMGKGSTRNRQVVAHCNAVGDHRLFGVYEREKLRAACMIVETEESAGLYSLCVAPRYQRKGLGALLLRECYAHARNAGKKLVLQSNSGYVPWYLTRNGRLVGSFLTFLYDTWQ